MSSPVIHDSTNLTNEKTHKHLGIFQSLATFMLIKKKKKRYGHQLKQKHILTQFSVCSALTSYLHVLKSHISML